MTICPLCQFNLEVTQSKIVRRFKEDVTIPIFYFSQVLGLALGVPRADLGFSRSIIPLKSFWAKAGNGGAK